MKLKQNIFQKLYTFFIKQGKRLFDTIQSESVKKNLLTGVPFWLGSLLVGGIAVFYARLFAIGEELLVEMVHYRKWLIFIVMPISFVLAWWIVKVGAPYAKGSGIPQVMAAVELANPRWYDKVKWLLGIRIIIYKIVSSIILVLGGAAIGREGPTIQISGAVFNKIYEFLPKWWPKISQKSMILTGAAAGLSAAFNTPLGGIVFAVEELTKIHFNNFKTAIFTAVIIAGLTSQQLAGSYLYLGFPKVASISSEILLAVIVVAIVAGISAAYLSKIILLIQKWRSGFKAQWQHIFFLIISALILASIAFFISTNVLGSGKELMEQYLFKDEHASWYTPLLRMIGPALSFTSGGAGGIFAPALSGGASIGSLFSTWFDFSQTEANVLILAGMVAFLTGITRAPFTSAILVLEMTDRHSLILHLMLAATIAGFAARIVARKSFYDQLKHIYIKELTEPAKHSDG